MKLFLTFPPRDLFYDESHEKLFHRILKSILIPPQYFNSLKSHDCSNPYYQYFLSSWDYFFHIYEIILNHYQFNLPKVTWNPFKHFNISKFTSSILEKIFSTAQNSLNFSSTLFQNSIHGPSTKFSHPIPELLSGGGYSLNNFHVSRYHVASIAMNGLLPGSFNYAISVELERIETKRNQLPLPCDLQRLSPFSTSRPTAVYRSSPTLKREFPFWSKFFFKKKKKLFASETYWYLIKYKKIKFEEEILISSQGIKYHSPTICGKKFFNPRMVINETFENLNWRNLDFN